ncbi:MAG: rod shape-determining protein MreC [Lachnospiraceae bacterium]|nr:rod shape-determining protein MreC [Lachnospiraceae bacterium]
MDFHDKKIIPPKYIYLFMAFICFILLLISIIFENSFAPLKAVTSAIITPMQSGVNEVGSSIYTQVSYQKEKSELLKENKALEEKIAEYYSQIRVYEQESYELKRLQKLLGLKEQYADYNTIGARVIATDSTNWFYTFVIDKGSDDGVKVGCNILADGGLAGIVTEVGTNYAKVRAIIDDNSSVSATVFGTETLCTVSGDLSLMKEGYISVGYINKADTIEEGSELVTSHVSDKFLPGILIGYISEIELDANNLTKSAKCIPIVDFHNLQEVLVVLDLKADYETDSVNKNIYDSIQSSENGATARDTSEQGTSEQSTSEERQTTSEENKPDDGDTEGNGSGDEAEDGSTGREGALDDQDTQEDNENPLENSPENGE